MIYYLIGLGIIMALIYGNLLYEYIKKRKGQGENQTAEEVGADEVTNAESDQVKAAGSGVSVEEALSGWVSMKLQTHQNIFGLPLTFCQDMEDGRVIAMDREENVYVIETRMRAEYADYYDQVMADMEAAGKQIMRDKTRQVYAIVCSNELTDNLRAAVACNPRIRVFGYDMVFSSLL